MSTDQDHKVRLIDIYDIEAIEYQLQDEIYECSNELYSFIGYLIEMAGAYSFLIKSSLEEHDRILSEMETDAQERMQMGMRDMWGDE